MKIKAVNELFDSEFFIKLKDFILKETFDDFYNRKLAEKRDYSKGYAKFWLNTEYLEDLEVNITYPLTYDWFIDTYNNDSSCAYRIDKYLFYIKYLIKEVSENKNSKYLNNKFCSIQFNKNIIEKVYNAEICKKLYNSRLKDLVIINLYESTTDFGANKNLTIIYARNLLLYIFEYLKSYLENLLKKIAIDTLSNIDSYRYETSMNILNTIPNQSKEMRKLTNKLKTLAKQRKTERFNEDSGTKPKVLNGYFPQTKEGLQNCIKRYENMLNEYPEIKKIIKAYKNRLGTSDNTTTLEFIEKYKKPISRKKINALKQYIWDYLKEKNSVSSFITLENDKINEFDSPSYNEEITELYSILVNYIDLLAENHMISFSHSIKYTLLEQSGNLHLFEIAELKEDSLRKFFARKKDNDKFSTEAKPFKIYAEKEFTEKYNKLFNT